MAHAGHRRRQKRTRFRRRRERRRSTVDTGERIGFGLRTRETDRGREDSSMNRCHWVSDDPLYIAYHDQEWGVPERDDRALFEKLILDGFQAGLSWITILRKRDHFRSAFDEFDPQVIARWNAKKKTRLLADPGIVRNRAKIEATVKNAQAWLEIMERGSFSDFIWDATGGVTLQNKWKTPAQVPAETDESRALSKRLKKAGFSFVGPTIVYAFMQATGVVNDHLSTCFRHRELC
jgi:DNA-3-methyladenine glycosylase I